MPTVEPVVVTPDAGALASFYADLLDAEVVERTLETGPAFAVTLQVDGLRLTLVTDEEVATGDPGRVLLSIGVEDVAAAVGRLEDLGGTVLARPQDMAWGERVAHAQDPDGNALNLTQPL
ncbi:VOC family protein [Pseudokineococcus basanitobsidens]|uniref:VOC family protein n=1 Tax=Pseudokineococcus basanitobsidens TaxID=1926649 RepID=A0ABU8RLK1_9ACTN